MDIASLHVGASIGVALAPEHAHSADELLHCADIAMYRAKNERGSFDVYEAALDDEADRFALIEDLRVAMADGSLALHYQPEVDLQTGRVVTVEALLRWPHPTLGLIPPEHLLALAEESGLVHSLAAWVFEEAISECAPGGTTATRWRSPSTCSPPTSWIRPCLDGWASCWRRSGLPPRALVLEITEGMVMADVTRSKRVIQSLTDSGIVVSIDDFGTGFSSLSHLNDLAVGELKLDRTFTSRLRSTEARAATTTSSAPSSSSGTPSGCASSPRASSDSSFVGVLAALGCDSGQGFAIQAPCPAAEIDFAGLSDSQTLAAGSQQA